MVILGLNTVFHDTTACLIKDGQLLIAIEQERLSRQKHTSAFPQAAIDACLAATGLTLADVDHIAVSFQPSLHLAEKMAFLLKNPKSALPIFRLQMERFYWKYRELNNWYRQHFNGAKKPRLHWVPHHDCHAAGTFLVSPYDKAALLSLDGAGEWATGFLGVGEGTAIRPLKTLYFPYSLGAVYEAITYFVGFKPAYDEGKTMGLAPYGDNSVYREKACQIMWVDDAGELQLDLRYFRFQECRHAYLSDLFIEVFGPARTKQEDISQRHMDVAAAFQYALEECALAYCRYLRRQTDAEYIVLAGGVALNSVMNGRIVRESGFKDAYIMPAAGDNGTALGAAYCVYHQVLNQPRQFVHRNPYVGNDYSNAAIEAVLRECKLTYRYEEDIEAAAAQLLHQGNIIGWMQGATEIGPRALGNRSILADPTKPGMKDKINAEVKHREAYRPFAPSVPVEHLRTYFDIDVEVPFMLKVCQVREDKKHLLPAITHVDGSARVQSVHQDLNPRYHRLINAFGALSGVPVVLNTSFNIMGEPVIETPYDAVRCFFSTGLDYLVLGNFVIGK